MATPVSAQPSATHSAKRAEASDEFSMERGFAPPPTRDDSDDAKCYYSIARYAVQNDHYHGLYQQWIKPIFFLVGKQWITWNQRQATYTTDTDVPAWRQQPVTNWTFAVYRTLLAKLTKQRPTLEVVPPSGDSDDREAAKLGESVLVHLWRALGAPQKVRRAIGWVLATGNVAFDVDWDPQAGELRPRQVLVEIADPEHPGQTIDVPCACDEEGEPERREPTDETDVALDGGKPYHLDAEPVMEPIGEISFEIDDPLCYRFNPEATSVEDAEEMFVAYLWPAEKVAAKYGIDVKDIAVGGGESGDEKDSLETILSAVTAGVPDPFNAKGETSGSSSNHGHQDKTLVIKYYRKQNSDEDCPEGRHWVTAGGKKVWPAPDDPEYPDGEAPLPFGFWPPRVVLVDTPIPSQPQGLGVLSQVVPLNEKYNYTDGKIGEYHTMMAMGGVIWAAPEDKGISITSEPGQVKISKAYGASGRHPIREKLEGLPAAVYNERAVIVENLRAIAGTSQADMGQKPEGVSAGRAFLVLQEASDAAITPTLEALEEALAEVGRRKLVVAQQKYTESRTIKIRGDKGQWEFRSFTNADLRDGLDVRVQAGSSFPWSKSAQWDTKLSVLQALPGLVIDAQTGKVDREQLGRFLDAGASGLAAFEADEDPDLVEIDREHAMFEEYDPTSPDKSNQLPQLAIWQDQVKHIKEHFDFMKRSFARFQRWSQPAQMAFMDHLKLTQQAVEQQVAHAMAASGQGAPPASGEPAPESGAAPSGGPGLALVPPGGVEGQQATPTARPKQSQLRLTAADRRSAGQ